MSKVKVITGYVPLKDHPRSAEEYGKLGEKLSKVRVAPLKAFYGQPASCWLTKMAWEMGISNHSEGDNPAKNTLGYHAVNHQKIEWLYYASIEDPEPEIFVWVDYGIMHVPGVTRTVIEDFLRKVERDPQIQISIPGCPGWDGDIPDNTPNWHFCGGVMVVPRRFCSLFYHQFKTETMRNLMTTHNVTWEVNDLARMAKLGRVPIRWYAADHNETMFTNY